MKNKIEIISLDPFIIKLNQDYKANDEINITECLDVNSKEFLKFINDFIEQKYKMQLASQKQELLNQAEETKEQALLQKTQQLQIEYNEQIKKLEMQNNDLQKTIETIEQDTIAKQQLAHQKIVSELNTKIELLKQEKQTIADTKTLEIKAKFNDEINSLNNTIKDKEHQLEIKKEQHQVALIQQQKEIEDQFNEQLQTLKEENEILKRQRNTLNIKELGNELENYCETEIQTRLIDTIGNDGSIIFKKDSIAQTNKKEKADFVVEFVAQANPEFVNNLKIVLEMKTETLVGPEENKKTNLHHIKKLVKNANDEQASIAILVTELEKQDKFYFRRINNLEYETKLEIYMVRPEFLVLLLTTLRVIFLKYTTLSQADIEFKEKEKILDEFNEFKESLLENQIDKINKKFTEIEANATKIISCAEKILEDKRLIVESHLKTLTKKIEDFKIENKVIKKLDKLN